MRGSILLLEHDVATRELIAGNLRHAGYQVVCTGSVADANTRIYRVRPDAVIIDWPHNTAGLALARNLRADKMTAHMSIIMVSARSDEGDSIAALESGADDFLLKPISMRELLARTKAVLRRRSPHLADDVIEAAGLRLEPAARVVTGGDREIELRKTEFDLLHFFMTHPNRAYSRSQLLDDVWGHQVFVEERTVDVHVRRLRRALASSGHDHLIQTVRSVGYRFQGSGAVASTWSVGLPTGNLTARVLRPAIASSQFESIA